MGHIDECRGRVAVLATDRRFVEASRASRPLVSDSPSRCCSENGRPRSHMSAACSIRTLIAVGGSENLAAAASERQFKRHCQSRMIGQGPDLPGADSRLGLRPLDAKRHAGGRPQRMISVIGIEITGDAGAGHQPRPTAASSGPPLSEKPPSTRTRSS